MSVSEEAKYIQHAVAIVTVCTVGRRTEQGISLKGQHITRLFAGSLKPRQVVAGWQFTCKVYDLGRARKLQCAEFRMPREVKRFSRLRSDA